MNHNLDDVLPLEWPIPETFNEFSAMHYRDFDTKLIDFSEDTLKNIGIDQEVEHLSAATFPSSPLPVEGFIRGANFRLMAPLVFQKSDQPDSPILNVWCLIDTTCPYTFLTVKTLEALLGEEFNKNRRYFYFAIQKPGSRYECHISKSNFEHVNIVGVDTLQRLNATPEVNWRSRMVWLKNIEND